MKIREIAQKYDLEWESFTHFANHGGHGIKVSLLSTVDDRDVDSLVAQYKEYIVKEERKLKALGEMLVSTGSGFEGYRIARYAGYVSGDDAKEMNAINTLTPQQFSDTLAEMRGQALLELKEAAFSLGCNAVTGISFDYVTLQDAAGPAEARAEKTLICVTANGNAVLTEKE